MYVHFLYLLIVAHAPRNVNRRIPTLKDLENEVKAAVPTSEVRNSPPLSGTYIVAAFIALLRMFFRAAVL